MNIQVSVTGLGDLIKRFRQAPDIVEKVTQKALVASISMVETESKRRTPVDTGLLRSSIGGSQGFKFLRGLTAGVGTNVRYAIYVHEGFGKHTVGQRKFMEKGLRASSSFIKKRFGEAMEDLAKFLVSKTYV